MMASDTLSPRPASSQSSQSRSFLGRLPAELRIMIYHCLIEFAADESAAQVWTSAHATPSALFGLLLTCRMFHDELAAEMYGVVLLGPDPMKATRRLVALGRYAAFVDQLRIDCRCEVTTKKSSPYHIPNPFDPPGSYLTAGPCTPFLFFECGSWSYTLDIAPVCVRPRRIIVTVSPCCSHTDHEPAYAGCVAYSSLLLVNGLVANMRSVATVILVGFFPSVWAERLAKGFTVEKLAVAANGHTTCVAHGLESGWAPELDTFEMEYTLEKLRCVKME